jgi:NAD(P)-dependent dehydrogenase (short-subunit alcohol dehydrogenase family)
MDIKGTGAVVTGAGSGIGRGIALALAEAGASGIVVADVQQERHHQRRIVHLDASFHHRAHREAVQGVPRYVAQDTYGRLDIAINVAGVAPRVPFKDFTEEHLMFMAKMHFIGPAMFIAAFAYMLVRDEFFETGQIWNYSGANSLLGHPRFLA